MSTIADPGRFELLAPAGEPRALRAALVAGADAVYFGLDRWSARAMAGNFSEAEAAEAVDLAHLYDARAYVALNTLLKDDEIEPALAALEAPYRAGLDALIVADLGFVARVREEYPDLPLHASTQLGTHSSSQLAALARLGFRRAVLARELSLDEIAALEREALELEVFVHGALCYGYSGDCLLSSMVGGRSGNRGRCSQSCRMRYELRQVAAEPSRILSTSDLAAIAVLPELIRSGVTSFKIEGRMKDAAYVGVTTAVYREALDAVLADPEAYYVHPEWMARLEQSFSRGFSTAHLQGRHHEVRSGGRGGHRGVLVGRVVRVDEARGEVEVRLSSPVSAGDLVYLYTPWGQSDPVRLSEGGDTSVTLRLHERVAVKDRLFRLAAAYTDELARDLIAGRTTLRPVGLRMRLEGENGALATLNVSLHRDPSLSVTTQASTALGPARTAALTEAKARDALGALGGTSYELAHLDYAVAAGLFMPVSELKDLRRRALAELDELRLAARRRKRAHPTSRTAETTRARVAAGHGSPAPDVLLVLRPGERPLAGHDVGGFCLDLMRDDPVPAVAAAADALRTMRLPVRVRLPEILFDGDEPWWRAVLALPWDAVYTRHLGLLTASWRPPVSEVSRPYILEYPMQGLNSLAVRLAAEVAGRPPSAVVVSPEASLEEIEGLAPGTAGLEVFAFTRQQLLHTRDHLGRAEGLYEAPGRQSHIDLVLKDTKGYEFPVVVGSGGSRLFNARVTNLAPNIDELLAAGVTGFLVQQGHMDAGERAAFVSGGLRALAPLASRERSTSAHLFRGVT